MLYCGMAKHQYNSEFFRIFRFCVWSERILVCWMHRFPFLIFNACLSNMSDESIFALVFSRCFPCQSPKLRTVWRRFEYILFQAVDCFGIKKMKRKVSIVLSVENLLWLRQNGSNGAKVTQHSFLNVRLSTHFERRSWKVAGHRHQSDCFCRALYALFYCPYKHWSWITLWNPSCY